MSWVGRTVAGTKTFIAEVKAELAKSAWPSRAELIESTAVIVIAVVLLGCFVGASDQVLRFLIRKLVT